MATEKSWERPWLVEQIIENSDKWSLAGDVALLNNLKLFADNLLTKTTEINNNLQNLTNNLNETSLKLNIAQNEFQSLRNSQFIESRVYEDDETLPQAENNPNVEQAVEPDRTEDIKLAALKGLEVLDKYFDKVEVAVSDSEDEDIDLPTYVLRPRDLYIDRPLPYIIGSEDWQKNWHVGLEDSSSDSETEKVSDKFSESDSESDLPIIQDRSQIKGTSDTSSELDFSQKTESIKPKSELFTSSDSDDPNSIPVKSPISNKNFAEQLADKLGNIINQEQEPQINTRPLQTTTHYGDLFFDEPPPITEDKGLFSDGSGLFDDDDDEDDKTQFSTPKTTVDDLVKPSHKGLFDAESSDDNMFNSTTNTAASNKIKFIEEPPALDEKKKPVGGVSIFGGSNLFDKKLLKRLPSSDDEEFHDTVDTKTENRSTKTIDLFGDEDLFENSIKDENVSTNTGISKKINLFDTDEDEANSLFGEDKVVDQKKPESITIDSKTSLFDNEQALKDQQNVPKLQKKISLFDDEDLFKDDLFSTGTKKKFTSGLFDDIGSPGDDLFSEKNVQPKLSENLFENLMAIPDDKNSVNLDNNNSVSERIATKESNKLDDDTGKNNLFDPKTAVKHSTSEEIDASNKRELPTDAPRISLFDSPPPETDDLFVESEGEPNTLSSETTELNPDVSEKSPTVASTKSDLFDLINQSDVIKAEDSILFEEPEQKLSDKIINPTANLNFNIFDSSFTEDDLFGDKSSDLKTQNDSTIPFALTPENDFKFTPTPVEVIPEIRLFDPNPPPDDEWETKSDNLSDDNIVISDQEDTTSQQSSSLFSDEPPALDISSKKSPQKVQSLTEKFQRAPAEEMFRPKSNPNSPGKLKHNLNINVGALMPGAARPKSEIQRSKTLDIAEESSRDELDKTSIVPTRADVEVLHSVTKDRPRVPFNRRPSTRRGRKAALRNSGIDFQLEKDEEVCEAKTTVVNSDSLFEPLKDEFEAKQEKLNPQSHLFSDEKISDTSEKEEVITDFSENVFPKSEPIDTSSKNEEVEAKQIQPHSVPKTDIFGDEDDDYDIFSHKVPAKSVTTKKMSLFDDDNDEDDDIFTSFKSGNVKKTESKVATEKRIPKTSSIKKLENTKPDDDPLSALLK